jgi:hypothetical protein
MVLGVAPGLRHDRLMKDYCRGLRHSGLVATIVADIRRAALVGRMGEAADSLIVLRRVLAVREKVRGRGRQGRNSRVLRRSCVRF